MGNFSRNTFDPVKNYVGVRLQQGVPLVDADWNELNDVGRQELYEGLDLAFAPGVNPGTNQLAVSPVVPAAPNDLLLLAGRGLVDGRPVRVHAQLQYTAQPWTDPTRAAQDGVEVIPPLTTPTADRIDLAYMDVWEREVRSAEDAALINLAIGVETCVRLKREVALRVDEGTTVLPPSPVGHFFLPLALLRRQGGQATIAADQVEDIRPSLYGRLGIATGLVVFESALTTQDTISGPINPGLGPGPIGVMLGLEATQIFVKPFELAQTPGLPQASVGAIIDPTLGRFRIGIRPAGTTPVTIRVRWWAFRPSQDRGTLVVPQGISVTIDPQTLTLRQGEQQRFTATVTGTPNQLVTWSIQEGPTGGVIDISGNYIAPNRAGTFRVVATSQADTARSATATVTVPAVGISISPLSAPLLTGRTQQFNAPVTGTVNTAVTWRVQEAGGGTVTAAGLYTAPNVAGTFHVIATSQADTTQTATATVTVSLITVSVSPPTASVTTGGQRQFTATVTGTSNTVVTWRVQEAGGGTISSTGLYQAPNVTGVFHVIATSQIDTTKSDSATVTVSKPKDTKDTKDTKEEKDTKEIDPKLAPKETDVPLIDPEPEPPRAPRRRRRQAQGPTGRAFIAETERPDVGGSILRGRR